MIWHIINKKKDRVNNKDSIGKVLKSGKIINEAEIAIVNIKKKEKKMDEKGGKRSKQNRQENGENRRIIFIFVPASAFDMFRLRLNQKDMQQNN